MRALMRRLQRESGQALVETAIVMPSMLFIILGILQLTLIQQANLMMQYAAFNAARTGSVWNMDPDRMTNAATVSILPTLGRTDDIPSLVVTAGKFVGTNYVLDKLGMPLLSVKTITPKKADFGGNKEIVFDDPANRLTTLLTIRAVYIYELRIPFANWTFFETWWAANAGHDLSGWDPGHAGVKGSKLNANKFWPVNFKAFCKYSGLDNTKMGVIRAVATATGRYYMPLVSTYTIRMQSNPFVEGPDGKQWAGEDNDGC